MDDYRFEEEQYKTYENDTLNDTKPKKRRTGIRVAAIILACVLTFSGIGYGVYRATAAAARVQQTALQRGGAEEARDTAVSTSTVASQDKSHLTTADRSASDDSSVLLTRNGIDETDTDAETVVLDVSEVVENVMPCVVAITDNLEVTSSTTYNPYSYYFGGSRSGTETKESVASGSGVIIAENDDQLLIVTNNHVVDNEGNYRYYNVSSTGLTVQFVDGETAEAVVKGTDSDEDLAVILVKLSDLSQETKDAIRVAVCGDSDEMKVGSGVIAIGNAMGYGQSVTTGIISAKDRAVTIDGITRYLMQTDAAINPGNSGGGLFNAKGELIGINSAKSVDTSVEGMGFAIPISTASEVIEELMNYEAVDEEDQGYLGINGETVPDSYVENYGYPKGVSVTRIAEGSPAEEAGLQIYDIITGVNGKDVESMNELKKRVNAYPAGTTITVTLSRPEGRGFKEMEIDVTLVRYDELTGAVVTPESDTEPADEGRDNSEENPGEWVPDEDSDIDSFFDWLFSRLK